MMKTMRTKKKKSVEVRLNALSISVSFNTIMAEKSSRPRNMFVLDEAEVNDDDDDGDEDDDGSIGMHTLLYLCSLASGRPSICEHTLDSTL